MSRFPYSRRQSDVATDKYIVESLCASYRNQKSSLSFDPIGITDGASDLPLLLSRASRYGRERQVGVSHIFSTAEKCFIFIFTISSREADRAATGLGRGGGKKPREEEPRLTAAREINRVVNAWRIEITDYERRALVIRLMPGIATKSRDDNDNDNVAENSRMRITSR